MMAESLPDIAPPSHIPIYSVVNDFLFPSQFRMHRMGFGIFLDSLKDVIFFNKTRFIGKYLKQI